MVTVEGHARRFYMRGDTVVFNPEAFNMEDGERVSALLRKLPGVTIDKDGNVKAEGSFGVSRTAPDPRDPATGTGMKAMGALTTNIPLPGGEYDWDGQGDNNTFLLLELTDDILSVGHANWPNPVPAKWTDDDWGGQIWLCWYKARK